MAVTIGAEYIGRVSQTPSYHISSNRSLGKMVRYVERPRPRFMGKGIMSNHNVPERLNDRPGFPPSNRLKSSWHFGPFVEAILVATPTSGQPLTILTVQILGLQYHQFRDAQDRMGLSSS